MELRQVARTNFFNEVKPMAQPAITPIPDAKAASTTVDITSLQSARAIQSDRTSSGPSAIRDFGSVVNDAMLLLTHAAETGTEIDETTRTDILNAKTAASPNWNDPGAAKLLAGLATLAAKLRPVTADSLRASYSNLVDPDIQSLRKWTCILAVPIILFSALGFVSSSISTAIRADIATANELAVKLRAELGSPASPKGGTPDKPLPEGLNETDVITQLQLYASTVRAIDARARQLNGFALNAEHDPYASLRWNSKKQPGETEQQVVQRNQGNQEELKKKFQINLPLVNMPQTLEGLTNTYQDVRSFAQDVLDLVSVYYGAITACLLPILYALLGTCAYLLRSFEEELRTLSFVPSSKTQWARFLIAGIGGTVVGLFNFVLTQSASVSPLAIAFLVGYAVDVFFFFLEGLLQIFTKAKSPVSSTAPTLSSSQ
jgi:hypothetical protein